MGFLGCCDHEHAALAFTAGPNAVISEVARKERVLTGSYEQSDIATRTTR